MGVWTLFRAKTGMSKEPLFQEAKAFVGLKHRFRKVGYNSFYIENLIDIGVDVDGDGLTDIVSSSYWSKPFTWWKHPGAGKRGVARNRDRIPLSCRVCILSGHPGHRKATSAPAAIWKPESCLGVV